MDIEKIIENIPPSDYGSLRLIVLRQPKRKEAIISPVWGRLIYSYEFENDYYPAIIIEAVDYSKKLYWNKSQSPDDQKEFERLKKDGHKFIDGKKEFIAAFELENVRNTQLYRTLPHEFGHYVQYLRAVEMQEEMDSDKQNKLFDEYLTIPKSEKERYANTYADNLLEVLEREKIIPFSPIL
ncbi:MAG: hypothetical protein JST32_10655 [Bacteroidetes bacterium]|nr:hypothetical protein [Bacteroidota bacterium]